MTIVNNPLVSSIKASESSLRALLHPLALLSITDYITRHTLRREKQPIAGALLGQQNGREVSIEVAYEVKLLPYEGSNSFIFDGDWFEERLRQYKEVHKAPALDLVGWWTVCPTSGPISQHLELHRYILQKFNESSLLLAFHPQNVIESEAAGGKLPLTIYESVYESSRDDSKAMQVDGEESKLSGEVLEIRFRELGYETVTGEAEMISVDFVARGGGNATAVDAAIKKSRRVSLQKGLGDDKGKGKHLEDCKEKEESSVLSAEDEELIASLTTRANAVKMLQSRLTLLQSYLTSLPQSYLITKDSISTMPHPEAACPNSPATSHVLLRAILALTARLPLLIPADREAFERESQAEKSDVALVDLLGGMGRSVLDSKTMGSKFAVVEQARLLSRKDDRRMLNDDITMGMGEQGNDEWDGMMR